MTNTKRGDNHIGIDHKIEMLEVTFEGVAEQLQQALAELTVDDNNRRLEAARRHVESLARGSPFARSNHRESSRHRPNNGDSEETNGFEIDIDLLMRGQGERDEY